MYSLPIPEKPALSPTVPFPPGEAEAQCRLSAFMDGADAPIYRYAKMRDCLDAREFYQSILYHFPYVLQQSFRADLQAIRWGNDKAAFAAW